MHTKHRWCNLFNQQVVFVQPAKTHGVVVLPMKEIQPLQWMESNLKQWDNPPTGEYANLLFMIVCLLYKYG